MIINTTLTCNAKCSILFSNRTVFNICITLKFIPSILYISSIIKVWLLLTAWYVNIFCLTYIKLVSTCSTLEIYFAIIRLIYMQLFSFLFITGTSITTKSIISYASMCHSYLVCIHASSCNTTKCNSFCNRLYHG